MTSPTPSPANEPGTLQTSRENALPEIPSPSWVWVLGKLSIPLSIILGVLSFVSYYAQILAKEVPDWVWIGAGTFLLLLWLLVPLVTYLWRGFKVVRARYRQYPIACAYGKRTGRELEVAQQRVNEVLPYVSEFELKHVVFEQTAQGTHEVYIVVAKTAEVHLRVGDNLRVIDETDARPMGVFSIQREREHDYFALGVDVDPMWLGSIYQDGHRMQVPPMTAVARLMQRSS